MDDNTWKAERDRRLRALSDLARQQGAGVSVDAPTSPPDGAASGEAASALPGSARPRRRKRVLVVVSVVALVAVLAAGIAYTLRQPAKTTRKGPPALLTITLPSDRMNCAEAAAWSPDGKYIAVLGQKTCPNVGIQSSNTLDTTGSLLLFDANSGHLVRGVTLDDAVIPVAVPSSVQHDQSPNDTLQVSYGDLVWSPDGRRIALTFSTTLWTQSSPINSPNGGSSQGTQYGSGLVLIDAASTKRTVFVISPEQQRRMGQQFQQAQTPGEWRPAATRWDISAGTASVTSFTPALAFTWTPEGTLAPGDTTASGAAGGVGNPDGGQAFTIWQTGTVSLTMANCASGPQGTPLVPLGFGFGSLFPAWSPDGAYLVLDVLGGTRLQHALPAGQSVAGASSCSGTDPSLAKAPPIAPRDAALATVLSKLTIGAPGAMLAWNLAGTRLATAASDSVNAQYGIQVYDCATGKLTNSLDAKSFGYTENSDQAGLPYMRWSPDGKRLMAMLAPGHSFVIWRPAA